MDIGTIIRRPLMRTRTNDPQKVKELMESIQEIGLQVPGRSRGPTEYCRSISSFNPLTLQIDVLEVDGVYYGSSAPWTPNNPLQDSTRNKGNLEVKLHLSQDINSSCCCFLGLEFTVLLHLSGIICDESKSATGAVSAHYMASMTLSLNHYDKPDKHKEVLQLSSFHEIQDSRRLHFIYVALVLNMDLLSFRSPFSSSSVRLSLSKISAYAMQRLSTENSVGRQEADIPENLMILDKHSKWVIFFSPSASPSKAHFFSKQKMQISTYRRPKKKVYHRVAELDRVMELRKKPSLILNLKNIITSKKSRSLLLRDLEKEVGFVQKWNYMSVIEKYPRIFKAGVKGGAPISVHLTEKAEKIASEEAAVREAMEPILVRNLRKLLMMSMDGRISLEKIEFIESDLGLPRDFKTCLIPKYPEFFTVKNFNGRDCLQLESWDDELVITAREEKLDLSKIHDKPKTISKDGNFPGPFAFRLSFPSGFRPNMKYLKEFEKWQRLEFPSPYLNARSFDPVTPQARKRAVAVLHELLSLTMEKRLTSAQLDAFHAEYQLPCKLLLCLIKNHGIFYITNKGIRSTVFLKEAYDNSCLKEKCPLLRFHDRFVALSGSSELSSELHYELISS
ncbi:hypothetical protein ACLOJK_020078 [Asimina triloba]